QNPLPRLPSANLIEAAHRRIPISCAELCQPEQHVAHLDTERMAKRARTIQMLAAAFAGVIDRDRLDVQERLQQADQKHPDLMTVTFGVFNRRTQKSLHPAPLAQME